ncbi:helix-turn-helix domain-containing protein [Streptomyces sp. NPDC101062]|uniref:helix-turn-helix domain-containing protein n=1 Tax=unclassified Streptomyces TaxID=2593676 RepID=UPI0038064206
MPSSSAPRTRLTPALVAELRTDIAAGSATITDVAQRFGVRWRTVESAAYGWTWRSVTDPAPLVPPEPQNAPPPTFARLTPDIVADMRRQYRAGHATFGRLARRHRVGESTVRNAVLGHTWRAVAEPPAERAHVGGWTVVSEDDEREIQRRRTAGDSFRSIAADLGRDVAVVHRAHRRLVGQRAG